MRSKLVSVGNWPNWVLASLRLVIRPKIRSENRNAVSSHNSMELERLGETV